MKKLPSRTILVIVSLLLLLALSAACAPMAPRLSTQPAGQATQAGVPVTGSQTVNVTETEFKLDMPSTVKAGMVTFNVTNNGTVAHSLEIQGQGIDQQLPSQIQPGQSGTLQVNLKPGTYMVFCPVDNHRGAGMVVTLTVQ